MYGGTVVDNVAFDDDEKAVLTVLYMHVMMRMDFFLI